MSETAGKSRNKIWTSLLRGRVTGRLNWKQRLTNAALPAEISAVISGVIKRTRLHGFEKLEVANELIAHFRDGLAAGAAGDDLVNKFGSPRAAARLISRAKRRGRHPIERIADAAMRVLAILIFIYGIQLLRICLGRANPSVDYRAKVNDPVLRTPPDDRAWPLWVESFQKLHHDSENTSIDDIFYGPKMPSWTRIAQWLDEHQSAIQISRVAGQKPSLGYLATPDKAADNFELFSWDEYGVGADYSVQTLVVRQLTYILFLDARHAAELGDGSRVEADLVSILGLARQVRDSNSPLGSQMGALGAFATAVLRLQLILMHNPTCLKFDQLAAIAHTISNFKVAADLIHLDGDRANFYDHVQDLYTDDGRSNGHLTFNGLRYSIESVGALSTKLSLKSYAIAASIPVLAMSRAKLVSVFDQVINQSEARLCLPLRLADYDKADSQLSGSAVDQASYALLFTGVSGFREVQSSCERTLGARDGALVAIALELYRRQHGKYPDSLLNLTPILLPQIPADRITGDPVKYRLIDGEPVVYSVGVDRIDDGGKPPEKNSAAQWQKMRIIPRGDWVLYPQDAGKEQ